MNFFIIFPYYLAWHYGRAFSNIGNIWKNYFIFIYNFFSIKTLLITLFSPWRRMGDEYREHSSLGDIAGTFVVNTLMRCVGAVMRLIIIIIGILVLLFSVVLGLAVLVIWLFLPAVLGYLVYFSFIGFLK